LSHLQSQVDGHNFGSFDDYRAAQASLTDLFEEVSPLLGPACGEVALEYMNQCEALREKMRLEFRLSEAQREADLLEIQVEEEKARAAQELKVMDEQMQAAKEERDRQIHFFEEEQAQLSARIVTMSEEANEREEICKARIDSLVRLQEAELARLETETKAQVTQQINLEKQRAKEKCQKLESELEEREEALRGVQREQELMRQELQEKIKKKRKTISAREVHVHHGSGPGLAKIIDKALDVGMMIAGRVLLPPGLPVPLPFPGPLPERLLQQFPGGVNPIPIPGQGGQFPFPGPVMGAPFPGGPNPFLGGLP
jgi:hypothetical protein